MSCRAALEEELQKEVRARERVLTLAGMCLRQQQCLNPCIAITEKKPQAVPQAPNSSFASLDPALKASLTSQATYRL